jgi:hypothetical protein
MLFHALHGAMHDAVDTRKTVNRGRRLTGTLTGFFRRALSAGEPVGA